jgi:DNA-binding transcriptional LysR family regulator
MIAAGLAVLAYADLLAVRFQEHFPHVDISMLSCQPDDVDEIFQDDQADLAIVSFESPNHELECQVFFDDQIILIVPLDHPWALKTAISPASATKQPSVSM